MRIHRIAQTFSLIAGLSVAACDRPDVVLPCADRGLRTFHCTATRYAKPACCVSPSPETIETCGADFLDAQRRITAAFPNDIVFFDGCAEFTGALSSEPTIIVGTGTATSGGDHP